MKKFKFVFLLIVTVILVFSSLITLAQPTRQKATASVNADYVRALFTANQFLYAWQTRDTEKGLALVSPALKSKTPNDELFSYISGTSSPSHAAFEIHEGRPLPNGRYAFATKLYEYYYAGTPESQAWKCPASSQIVVVKSRVNGRFRVGDWLVDELPKSCNLTFRY